MKFASLRNRKGAFFMLYFTHKGVATGGVVGPISVALQEDGETLTNAVAVATPAAVGVPATLANFFNVSLTTFITIPCGCCVTVSVENTSDGTAIDIANANIIFDRVA